MLQQLDFPACSTSAIGGATPSCDWANAILQRPFLIKPDASFANIAAAKTKAGFLALIASGDIVPLPVALSGIEDISKATETGDDIYGNLVVNSDGQYRFSFMFEAGLGQNAALRAINQYKNWSVILPNADGVFPFKSSDGTKVQGVPCGVAYMEKITLKTAPGTSTYSKITISIKDAKDINENARFAKADFDFNELDGLAMTIVGKVSDTAEQAVITVKDAITGASVSGLTADNFSMINGSTLAAISITSATESGSTGQYTLAATMPGDGIAKVKVLGSAAALYTSDYTVVN